MESVFKDDDGKYKRRSFTFGAASGVKGGETLEILEGRAQQRTMIALDGFRERYRQQAYKTAVSIGAAIVEHCLWYFVRPGGTANIVIEDDGEALQLDKVYEHLMHASAIDQQIEISPGKFTKGPISVETQTPPHGRKPLSHVLSPPRRRLR